MTITDVSVVKDPHSDNYASKTTSDNEIGGHAVTPSADDDTELNAKKAGVHPDALKNKKV